MKNQTLKWNASSVGEIITRYYDSICGFDKDRPALIKRKQTAYECLDDVIELSEIKAVVSKYTSDVITKKGIKIDDYEFLCIPFKKLETDNVEALYVFAVQAGDVWTESQRVLIQAYYDMSGTAVADVARDLLKSWIEEQHPNSEITEAFGPGFYGMSASDVEKFSKILDLSLVGISLLPSGFMIPPKSCVGFYLVMKENAELPELDCVHCLGRGKMCNYCKAGRKYGY